MSTEALPRVDSLHRIHCLDGLRAMAAVMVMLFHYVGLHGEPARVVQAMVIGQTGVDLFFVLSGFLITRILLLSKESPHYFRNFYMRRSLRVFPLYYAFLAFYFLVMPHLLGYPVPPLREQWWGWFYLENLPLTFGWKSSGPGHFWTLAIEEQFYLLWPLLVYALSRRGFTWIVVGTLVLAPVLRLVFLHFGLPVFFFTLTRMDALGYGALLAVLLTDARFLQVRLFRWVLLSLIVLLAPTFLFLSGSGLAWMQVVKSSMIPALYFALLGFCVVDPAAAPLSALFSLRWVRWLGGISYGLYVFHPGCFRLVEMYGPHTIYWLATPLSFGLTILVAYLSFRFFESPILKLKRHFHYETRSQTPPAAGAPAVARA